MKLSKTEITVLLAGYISGLSAYLLYKLYKIETERIADMLSTKRAYDILMKKVYAGEYVNKTPEEIQMDFAFYRISSRLGDNYEDPDPKPVRGRRR